MNSSIIYFVCLGELPECVGLETTVYPIATSLAAVENHSLLALGAAMSRAVEMTCLS